MRRASITFFLALVAALLASGCTSGAGLDAHWPRAERERTTPRPVSTAVWPLTGKPALDETAAASAPVVLAVADVPAAASLPGLDSADVVYEIALGAGDVIAAVFHSSLPPSAGPLRNGTPSDAALAAAYRARLVGRAEAGKAALADVASLAAVPATGGAVPPPAAVFASRLPSATPGPSHQIVVPLAAGSKAEWRWDARSGAYQRFVDAKPALAAGSRLIRAVNVVVIWVPPAAGWPDAAMTGSGRASIFTGGARYVGSWEASGAPPGFRDVDGEAIALLPGNTWVEVVGTATNIVLR